MTEQPHNGTPTTAAERAILCPYCGHIQPITDQCARCRGLFEPLSRQATQNAMGPWQIRDVNSPFAPGCSYETLKRMVEKGRITRATIVRGPSTRQFWSLACNTPGVSVLLGECHHCHSAVRPDEYICRTCSAVLTASTDRQQLGLGPVKLLPGEAPPHEVASVAAGRAAERPGQPDHTPIAPTIVPSAPTGREIRSRRSAERRERHREEAIRSTLTAVAVFALILVTVVTISILTAREPAPPQPTTPAAP